jgi:hypothetical protein
MVDGAPLKEPASQDQLPDRLIEGEPEAEAPGMATEAIRNVVGVHP